MENSGQDQDSSFIDEMMVSMEVLQELFMAGW